MVSVVIARHEPAPRRRRPWHAQKPSAWEPGDLPALRPIASSGHKLAFEEAIPSMLLPLVTITKFDVILMLRESGRELVGCCVYKPHLFRASMIDRILRDFRKVLELMLTQPDRPISTMRTSLNGVRRNS